jgi:hypothetical protein
MKTGQVVTSIVEELTCISCRGYIFDLDGNRLACKAWGGAKCRGRQLAFTESTQVDFMSKDRCPLYHPDTVERCTLKEGHSVLHRTTKGSEWYSTPGAEAAAKCHGDGPGTFKSEADGPGTDAYALALCQRELEAAHRREVSLSNKLTTALAAQDKANERAMMLGRKLDEVSEELKRTQDTLDKILSRD